MYLQPGLWAQEANRALAFISQLAGSLAELCRYKSSGNILSQNMNYLDNVGYWSPYACDYHDMCTCMHNLYRQSQHIHKIMVYHSNLWYIIFPTINLKHFLMLFIVPPAELFSDSVDGWYSFSPFCHGGVGCSNALENCLLMVPRS